MPSLWHCFQCVCPCSCLLYWHLTRSHFCLHSSLRLPWSLQDLPQYHAKPGQAESSSKADREKREMKGERSRTDRQWSLNSGMGNPDTRHKRTETHQGKVLAKVGHQGSLLPPAGWDPDFCFIERRTLGIAFVGLETFRASAPYPRRAAPPTVFGQM